MTLTTEEIKELLEAVRSSNVRSLKAGDLEIVNSEANMNLRGIPTVAIPAEMQLRPEPQSEHGLDEEALFWSAPDGQAAAEQ